MACVVAISLWPGEGGKMDDGSVAGGWCGSLA
jgi:hypothetical protein